MTQVTEHYCVEEYSDEIYMVYRVTDLVSDPRATGIKGKQAATDIAFIFEMMENKLENLNDKS